MNESKRKSMGEIGGHDDKQTFFIDGTVEEAQSGERVTELYAMVSIAPNGGEGIYGRGLPSNPFVPMPIIVSSDDGVAAMDGLLRREGDYEIADRRGTKLEWRKFTPVKCEMDELSQTQLVGLRETVRQALDGDSNDAEHDALVDIAELIGA